jgi:hypothetical protein
MASLNLNNDTGSELSIKAFRVVGYGLLIMSLFDLVSILVRVRSLDPGGLFQTAGAIIERTPVPVLGFLLIFFGDSYLRRPRERLTLQIIRWLALAYGVGLWLFVPLILTVTLKLNTEISTSINAQATPQLQKMQQVETNIQQAKPTELDRLLKGWNQQSNQAEVKDAQTFKTKVLKEIKQSRETLHTQMQTTEQNRRFELITNATKWLIAAIVSGFLLIYLWQLNGRLFG